jgi:hypothetical protein
MIGIEISMNNTASAHNASPRANCDRETSIALEDLLSAETDGSHCQLQRSSLVRLDGVVIGTFVDRDDQGRVLVDFPGNPAGVPVAAQTTVELNAEQRERDVALMFQQCDPGRPLVIGLIQHPQLELSLPTQEAKSNASHSPTTALQAEVDDERIVLKANKEIVLRCGKASITLTRAGKVLIRGAYLLNRSSGVNRIKGGSVQIN